MAKKLFLIIVLFFLAVGTIFFARGKRALLGGLDDWLARQPIQSPKKIELKSLEIQVSEGEAVSIEAQLANLSVSTIDFNVTLTTHSIDLNFDLTEKARLNSGTESLKPVSWSGGRGGHHLSGRLRFPALTGLVSPLRLVLSDPLLGQERVFEWTF